MSRILAIVSSFLFASAFAIPPSQAAVPETVSPSVAAEKGCLSCLEGDNASREQEAIEALICDQYLRGFEDAYLVIGGTGYCFPSGPDRVADARRRFIKWGVNNTKAHGWAAADGVLAAMGCR